MIKAFKKGVICIFSICLLCCNVAALTYDEMDTYNNVEYPLYVNNNGMNSSPQNNLEDLSVDPVSGNLRVKVTDISLPGKNGFDLNLTRIYNSQKSNLREPYVATNETTTPKTFYKIVGKKNYEYQLNHSGVVYQGANVTVCIKPTYNPDETDEVRCRKYMSSDENINFEYSNTMSSPPTTYLFENAAEAQAMCDRLNGKTNDINATSPYTNYAYYKVEYYDFHFVEIVVQVPGTVSTTDILEYTTTERYSRLGAGWEFDFPYIETRYGYRNEYHFLHYGDKGTYEIDMSADGGTNHLKGYPLNDIIVTLDDSVRHDGITSMYCVTEKNGKKSYFAEIDDEGGKDGRLLLQRDRFGNEIKFYYNYIKYECHDLEQHRFPYLTRIEDSAGRTVTFTYGNDYDSASNKYQDITVDITDTTNDNNSRQIVYKRKKLPKSTIYGSGSSTLYENEYALTNVIKANGEQERYSYTYPQGRVNFLDDNTDFYNRYIDNKSTAGNYINDNNESEVIGTNTRYALLSVINFPNQQRCYINYSRFLRHCTSDGSMMFWKVYHIEENSREDENGNTILINSKKYTYLVDGNLEYDGYPLYNREGSIDSNVRYKVKEIDRLNINTELAEKVYTYKYLGERENQIAVIDNTVSTSSEHKNIASYTYDPVTKLTTQIINNLYDSPSSNNYITYQQNYTYDSNNYGDVITEKLNNNSERITTYTYHPVYHYLTSKIYKANANTIYKDEYISAPDGKSVEWYRFYENDVLKKQTRYEVDVFGNVVNQKEYSDNNTDYTETQFNYNDNDAARDGQFDGVFVTQKIIKAVTDADGLNSHDVSESYCYDWFGNVLTQIDGNGNTYAFEYDKIDRVIKAYNPEHTESNPSYKQFEYCVDSIDSWVVTTDELGNVTSVEYDTSNNRIREALGDEPWQTNKMIVENWYDHNNQLIKTIEFSDYGNDKQTIYDYDTLKRLKYKEVIDSNNQVVFREDHTYNVVTENGVKYLKETVTTQGDASAPAITVEIYRDAYDCVVKRVIGSDVENYSYDYLNRKIVERSARANSESWQEEYTNQYVYDWQNNVVKVINVAGDFSKAEYDNMGRLIKSYDFEGAKEDKNYYTEYKYDKLNRVIEQKTPIDYDEKNSIAYSIKKVYYDDNGNVILETQTNNAIGDAESWQSTEYSYDTSNRLVKTTGNDGTKNSIVQNYYDKKGNLLRVYTGLSSPLTINGPDEVITSGDNDYAVTKYTYDALGRVTSTQDALGQTETNTYDRTGLIVSQNDRNGNTVSFAYDGLGNVKEKAVVKDNIKTNVITTVYGKNNALITASNDEGVLSYTYDNHGRLVSETNGTKSKTYTYDAAGNRKSFTLNENGTVSMQLNYEYDKLNRLSKVYEGAVSEENVIAEYLYDDNGNRVKTTLANGNTVEYEYNIAGLLEALESAGVNEAYEYYLSGNQASKTVNGITTTYEYDNMNRLTVENDTIYTFDDYGNQATKTDNTTSTAYEYDKNNRLQKSVEMPVGDSFTETDNKAVIKEISNYFYDKNGNIYSKTIEQHLFNSNGDESYSAMVNDTNSLVTYYSFNPYNQLTGIDSSGIKSEYKYYADGMRKAKTVDGMTTTFVYDGANIVEEITLSKTNKYYRGIEIIKNGDGLYYIYNGQGDVAKLTNSEGTSVTDYTFDAYGNQIQESTVYNPFGYRGEYQDLCSGLIYLRNRYYDPSIGRFISEDPVHDGLNWYVYCNNNPISFIDPLGLAPSKEEAAYMAKHIYGDYDMGVNGRESRTVAGWRLIDIFDGGAVSSIKMGIYIPDRDDWKNPSEYALVFRGSTTSLDLETASVWANNLLAYGSSASVDMWAAIGAAVYFDYNHSQEITFVGHSKGGGEAIAAATATGKNAITFNAANFDFNNYGLWERNKKGINNYYIKGEFLSAAIRRSRYGTNHWETTQEYMLDRNIWGFNVKIPDLIKNHDMDAFGKAWGLDW